jgi:hypothetical protein
MNKTVQEHISYKFRYRRPCAESTGYRKEGEDDYVNLNEKEGEESGSDQW